MIITSVSRDRGISKKYYSLEFSSLTIVVNFNVVMKPGSVLLPRISKFTVSSILSSPLGLLFSLMAFLVWLLPYTASDKFPGGPVVFVNSRTDCQGKIFCQPLPLRIDKSKFSVNST
jgi:hypothetical protein